MMRWTVMSLAALMAVPAAADTPAKAVPTPLERAMLQSVTSGPMLERTALATGKPQEIARSATLINEILEGTRGQTAPEITAQSLSLLDIRHNYGLSLSPERMGALLVAEDTEDRLATLQAATETVLSPEELAEIDDEIFWASFDPDRGDPAQEFKTEDGSIIRLETDPKTRQSTIEVMAQEAEEGLPFNLALPTRWVVATEETDIPQDQEEDLMVPETLAPETATEAQDTSDWDDDIFVDVPTPRPVPDPDHAPKILTQDMRDDIAPQLNGLWEMSGFRFGGPETWFITADIGTSNAVEPSRNQAQSELDRLRDELAALSEAGGTAFVWRNRETGEQVRQDRYKRLDIDSYDYLGEQSAEEEVQALKEQIQEAEQRLEDGRVSEEQTLAGFDRVKQRAGSARVRELGPCGGVMDEAWFDGLNLGVRDIADRRCDLQQGLPEAVKSQLVGNVQIPWIAVFSVVPDPRSDQLILRGTSWGGQVHYDQASLKVSGQSGPVYYSAPRGARSLQDENTLLSGSAMGADDDEAL